MKTLIVFASLAVFAYAAPGGIHGGTIVAGPAGVVTDHGAIGPAGHGHGLGLGLGLGLGGLGYGGHGAYVAGPAVVAAPAVAYGGHGLGLGLGYGGLGYGGYGGYGHGLGLAHGVAVTNGGGVIGLGHHGVTVKGPATVPATIAGPSGKIVADGLYGVPTHHGHGW